VTVVIPVFNEAEAVGPTLQGLKAAIETTGRSFELILVDDGSTDGTLEAAGGTGVPFRAIRHSTNRGYGAAVKTGLRHAVHPWILIIDADGSYPPEEAPRLLQAAEDETVAMVVGRRRQSRATDGPARLLGKRIVSALANYLAGTSLPDLNSGLRLMRRADVERFRPLLPDGFSLTTSITLALHGSGAAVTYVPIQYRPRLGHSKIRPLRDMAGFIALIARIMIYFNPLKVFLPLAGGLIAAALATVILSKTLGGQVMDVTALFLFVGGLQMLLIGLLADLILKLHGLRR